MNNSYFPDFMPLQEPPKKEKRYLRDLRQIGIPLLALSFIFLFTVVVQLLLQSLIATFAPEVLTAPWYMWGVSRLPMYAVAMPLSILLYMLAPATPLQKKELSFPAWLGLVSICFTVVFAGNLIGNMMNMAIGAVTGEVPKNDLAEMTSSSPLWSNLLFVGILAPVMEEIFFRKLILDRWNIYGYLPAALLSGIAFGLVHGNFYQFFYAAGTGIVFGMIYLQTGKLRYTISLHMAVNLVGGVYTTEMLRKLGTGTEPVSAGAAFGGFAMMFSYYAFVAIALVGCPVAIIFLRKHIKMKKGTEVLSAGDWVKALLLNPAVWIFMALVALMFL